MTATDRGPDLTIDTHTHYMPPQARQILSQVATGSGGYLASLKALPDASPMFQVDERLQHMDRVGIDVAVVSLAPVDVLEDQGVARDLVQAGNEGLVELCTHHPGRFVMMASMPMPDAVGSLAALERVADEPALRGITFPSHATLHRPDQIGMEPMLARAAQLGLPVMLHPSGGNTDFGTVFNDFGLGLSFHAMLSGPLVVLRMIGAGVFDRIPKLEIIVPMLGGVLPFVSYRQDGRLKGRMEKSPTEYMRTRIFFDTSCFPAGPAFRCTLDTVGLSQLILGSDYPSWDMEFVTAALREMELSPTEQQAISGGNASRWFDPGRPRRQPVAAPGAGARSGQSADL
jgi:aminocarboxymuconate-semialdehyde decarboxylase